MTERRWITRHIDEAAFEQLATGLPGTTLRSVLLEVLHQRAGSRTPVEVLDQYGRDAFCTPAPVDLRTAHAIDGELLAAAHDFEALDLSPVAPLGTCSTVAPTSQHRVLSALRMTEVVSDPTNVMAMECARRLRANPNVPVHLATSQRVLRAQPFPKGQGFTQHFRMFALSSGGREEQGHAFTVRTVARHVHVMLDAFRRLSALGYAFGEPRVDVLATPEREAVAEQIVHALAPIARRGALSHPYYSGGIRFQIWATPPDGDAIPLVDGGTFDWLGRLASNRRAVFVATGTGSQLIAMRYLKDV
jgi:hypothetical protein